VTDSVQPLYRLAFARGSEALDFVRMLRELSESAPVHEVARLWPILVYGARIVTPDSPANLYASVGALALAYALGMTSPARRVPRATDLPADLALLFGSARPPDETAQRA